MNKDREKQKRILFSGLKSRMLFSVNAFSLNKGLSLGSHCSLVIRINNGKHLERTDYLQGTPPHPFHPLAHEGGTINPNINCKKFAAPESQWQ